MARNFLLVYYYYYFNNQSTFKLSNNHSTFCRFGLFDPLSSCCCCCSEHNVLTFFLFIKIICSISCTVIFISFVSSIFFGWDEQIFPKSIQFFFRANTTDNMICIYPYRKQVQCMGFMLKTFVKDYQRIFHGLYFSILFILSMFVGLQVKINCLRMRIL